MLTPHGSAGSSSGFLSATRSSLWRVRPSVLHTIPRCKPFIIACCIPIARAVAGRGLSLRSASSLPAHRTLLYPLVARKFQGVPAFHHAEYTLYVLEIGPYPWCIYPPCFGV